MSAFAKPSTPTKTRSNIMHTTPTKTSTDNSGSNVKSNHSSSTKVLEEINLLLHLETLKRYRDNEVIFRQKVEEAHNIFEESRCKYFSLIAKYTTLVKLAYTRKVLQRNDLVVIDTKSSCTDVINVVDKLSSGSATDYICTRELEKFKKMLHDIENCKNLPIRRSELVDLKKTTDDIQHCIEAIEISLEKYTTQGLDHFICSLDMMNYPKVLKELEQKEY